VYADFSLEIKSCSNYAITPPTLPERTLLILSTTKYAIITSSNFVIQSDAIFGAGSCGGLTCFVINPSIAPGVEQPYVT
jgi:hypothetical protein